MFVHIPGGATHVVAKTDPPQPGSQDIHVNNLGSSEDWHLTVLVGTGILGNSVLSLMRGGMGSSPPCACKRKVNTGMVDRKVIPQLEVTQTARRSVSDIRSDLGFVRVCGTKNGLLYGSLK
jgi:hypothetical protein